MSYNLKNIRALLIEGFSDADLRRFCFDEPAFRPVYTELSSMTGKAGIVDKLLEYAMQQELIDQLLNWAKIENPAKYDKLKPYTSTTTPAAAAAVGKEIFISYAWGGEREQIVNQLDQAFQTKGITIVRDKRDLGFKGRIKTFMEQIGRGKAVIAIISDKYLKSPNCMFELVQIAKNGQFYDRIFPVVLADAQIYDPVERIEYVKHWEEKINKLNEAMKGVSLANLQGFRDEIDQYTEIRNTMAELVYTLKDMNTLTPEMHSESGFEELFQAVEHKLAE